MAKSWADRVRNTGQLTICAGKGATGGAWNTVFNTALLRFNTLAQLLSFNVKMVASTTPPDPNGTGGADILFDTGNKQISFKALGKAESEPFNGNALHGKTRTVALSFGVGPARIEKAFIFVPENPLTSGAKPRTVGSGVMLVIAVHELVHACGLNDPGDHSPFNDQDLFTAIGTLSEGKNPQDDKLEFDKRKMPPVWMSYRTAAKIQSIW